MAVYFHHLNSPGIYVIIHPEKHNYPTQDSQTLPEEEDETMLTRLARLRVNSHPSVGVGLAGL